MDYETFSAVFASAPRTMPQKKTIFAGMILLFAGITLSVQVGKEFYSAVPLALPEGVNVICTHATVRCPTCLIVERLTREVLAEHFPLLPDSPAITFHALNYERPEFDELAKRFKIATATVLLVKVKDSQIVEGKTLTNETWKYYTDSSAFKAMLNEQLDAFLESKTLEPIDPTEIFVFEPGKQIPVVSLDQEQEPEAETLSGLSDEELDRRLGVDEGEIGTTPDNYVWVLYFHRLPECEACREMSRHLQEFFTGRFHDEVQRQRIVFRYRNFEEGSNAALVQTLKIVSPSLVILLVKDGKSVKAKRAGRIWSLTAEKEELFDYLDDLIQPYLEEEARTGEPVVFSPQDLSKAPK